MASLSSAVDGGASHLDPILIAMRDHGVVVSFFHAGSTDTPTLIGAPGIAVLHDNDFSQQPDLSRYPLLQRFIVTCGGAYLVHEQPATVSYLCAALDASHFGKNALVIETHLSRVASWQRLVLGVNPYLFFMIEIPSTQGPVQ